jgi:hypothetical protein
MGPNPWDGSCDVLVLYLERPFSSVGLIEALRGRFGYSDLKEATGSWVAMGFEWCCAEAEGIGDQWCQWCVVWIQH